VWRQEREEEVWEQKREVEEKLEEKQD